jgi:nodulation protein E
VPNVGREKKLDHVMSNSFAFGGLNAVLVFSQPPKG